jgi:hypothetical protein
MFVVRINATIFGIELRCNQAIKDYLLIVIDGLILTISLRQSDDIIKAAISIRYNILVLMFLNIPDPKGFIP